MHVNRFPLQFVYDGHVRIHHLLNRGDGSFNTHGPEGPVNINLRWFSFPAILLIHMPAAYFLQRLTGASTMAAAFIGATAYYAGFEYTHYLMHVPQGHAVERFRWFRFLCEHHRLHHSYMRCNFNVFLPLADLCLGTLRTTESWRARPVDL